MAVPVFRGKAQVAGTAFAADVIIYPVPKGMDMAHAFELMKVQDANGADMAWSGRNEMINGDLACWLVGDTLAHAETGAAFLAPLAIVTISTVAVAEWNTTWAVESGSNIKMVNNGTAEMGFKLFRYVDGTQNALLATTPS